MESHSRNILKRWAISPKELTLLVDDNPSLRGMLFGYVAELKLTQLLAADPRITESVKHDDHDRKKKGDRVVTYRGQIFIIESKSLQTATVHRQADRWIGKAQVDASDRRTVTLKDGSTLQTTLLLVGEFDVLAVNCFEFGQEWRWLFCKNSDLPRSSWHGCTKAQQRQLLASLVEVTWPAEPPFRANIFKVLDELITARS